MKKNKYIFILVLVLALIAVGILLRAIMQTGENAVNQVTPISISDKNVQDSVIESNVILHRIPSDWKTYTNKQLGFTFQYPDTWFNNGEDVEIVNEPGTIAAIEINFTDSIFHTSLLIEYHFAPHGAKLYQFAVSQFDSAQGLYATNREKINVGGNNAIKGSVTMDVDGKGHKLNPPLKLIVIDFLDMKQTGEIKMKFKTPLSEDNIESAKFERLLSTFKFTN